MVYTRNIYSRMAVYIYIYRVNDMVPVPGFIVMILSSLTASQ